MNLIRGKKGDVTDVLVFLIVIFILAIGLFIIASIIPPIADGLRDGGLNGTTEGFNAIASMEDLGSKTINRGFFLLFMGLVMGTMVSSFFVRTHPIFIFLYISFLAITVFIGTYLGNAYETFSEVAFFANTLAEQTFINLVMGNIVQITIAVGILSMIIVFAKFTGGRTDTSV